MDAPHALARLLIELIEGYEMVDDGAIDIDVPLGQHELASLIGVSRNSMVRALSTLRSRRLLATTRGTLRILDAAALRRYGDTGRQ